ncbi:hypothetical protein H4R34_000240 [Dimargaris verticillata]|uniref:CCHC-type domain-containing protein n=1 Tax=Dimargaris verticillata TaxID=2761393 RepID=A0A9W8EBH0_9FUNG|nr:hypothetical protein H4R34_000240 [Dimargaris verticillata]
MDVDESTAATRDSAIFPFPDAEAADLDGAPIFQPEVPGVVMSNTPNAHMPGAHTDTDANAVVAAQARQIAELEAQLIALKPIAESWLAHPDAPIMLLVRDQPAWRCDAFRHCLGELLSTASADDASPALMSSDAVGNTTSHATHGQRRCQGRKSHDSETIERVVAAFEYLLSDDYLAKDKYLRALIDEDTERSVNINYLSNMASIRELKLARPELEAIMRKHAKSVEFIGQSRRIRRVHVAPSPIAPDAAASPTQSKSTPLATESATTGLEAKDAIATNAPETQPSSPPSDRPLSSDSSDDETSHTEQPTLCNGFIVFLDSQLYLDHIRTTVDTNRIYLGPYDGQYNRDTLNVVGAPSQSAYDRAMPPNICFNCGSPDHVISKCPVPRNNERIERNVALFRAHQPETYSGRRYYIDFEALERRESRLTTLVPGTLSKPLREALGLISEGTEVIPGVTNGTPEFVKRMERFGYPPSYIGTTPDQDPLLPAKNYQPSFTPLKMYTGAELTATDPPTPPKEPATPTTPTTHYPLVSYPGLDSGQFDFTTTPLGAPKSIPAIWDHSVAPRRSSSDRSEFLDDSFASLLSSYHGRSTRPRTNYERGYGDRYDYGCRYGYDYEYDIDRHTRSSRERSSRSYRPYTRYRAHGSGQASNGGINGGDYYRPDTERYRSGSPPPRPPPESALPLQLSTGPIVAPGDNGTPPFSSATEPSKAPEPTESDLEDGELDMEISD